MAAGTMCCRNLLSQEQAGRKLGTCYQQKLHPSMSAMEKIAGLLAVSG